VKAGWSNSQERTSLAEFSKEGYSLKRAVLPMMTTTMMMMMTMMMMIMEMSREKLNRTFHQKSRYLIKHIGDQSGKHTLSF
jgi:hypothetical protein